MIDYNVKDILLLSLRLELELVKLYINRFLQSLPEPYFLH